MDKPIILIVDDEEANLQLIGKILQNLDENNKAGQDQYSLYPI